MDTAFLIFGIILFLIAVGFGVAKMPALSAGLGILGLALVVLASTVIIQPKETGVVVQMGKVSEETLTQGFHWKSPIASVVKISGTNQVDKYEGDARLGVRIGDGSNSYVSLALSWRLNADNANKFYSEYRDSDPTDFYRANIVQPNLREAVQAALADFNPIAEVQGADSVTDKDISFNPDYKAISSEIKSLLVEKEAKSGFAEILDVTVTGIDLSQTTQDKLNQYTAAVGEARVKDIQVESAKAEALANEILSKSLEDNANLVGSKCLDIVREGIAANYQFPAGFSCAGGSSVVIPGTNTQGSSEN